MSGGPRESRAPEAAPREAAPRESLPPEAAPRDGLMVGTLPTIKPPPPTFFERRWAELVTFLEDMGVMSLIAGRTVRALFARPLEWRSTVYQLEAIGVASVGIAGVTAVFIGMVMALQFAYGLQKFGGLEYVGRIMALSFVGELAPSLTAVIVGGRVGAGIAAEVGSMAVTEQIDAIRALGADPVKKLVLPRVLACTVAMPILAFIALVLGFLGGMGITTLQFELPAAFFFRSAVESVSMKDLLSGMGKTPFFGFIIGLVGCHFGMKTRGGTEGVGRSTTSTVVAVSIAILITDFFLTRLFQSLF